MNLTTQRSTIEIQDHRQLTQVATRLGFRLLQELINDNLETRTKTEEGQPSDEEQFKFEVDIDGHPRRAYLKSITRTSDGLTTGVAEALVFYSPVQGDNYRLRLAAADGTWRATVESVVHIDNG